jgi:hypothetical protein
MSDYKQVADELQAFYKVRLKYIAKWNERKEARMNQGTLQDGTWLEQVTEEMVIDLLARVERLEKLTAVLVDDTSDRVQ